MTGLLQNVSCSQNEERKQMIHSRGKFSLKRLLMILAAVMALGVGATACGGDDDDGSSGSSGTTTAETKDATLVLDFIPNAVHAGIYAAQAQGYYEENGINLEIIQPTSTADTLRLIDAGKADIGIADGIDMAGQIDQGRGAKGVMAILQRPPGRTDHP